MIKDILVVVAILVAFGVSRASERVVSESELQRVIAHESVTGYEIDASEACEIIMRGQWNEMSEYCITNEQP